METKKLIAQSTIQIQKSIEEVFDGIVNPDKMKHYFISESSGKMEKGSKLQWKFPEFSEYFPIDVVEVIENQLISFVWDPETLVQIKLTSLQDGSTLVNVEENDKILNDQNLKWALGNTGGWANFLACMKAYLEYGIELRKGAFDYLAQISE